MPTTGDEHREIERRRAKGEIEADVAALDPLATDDLKIISAGSLAHGRFEGASDGPASISMILDESGPGRGPRLHRHPYDETWVIQEGNLLFQVGDNQGEAGPGDIVLAPPGLPHKFINQGPGRARLICIHASPTIVGEFLE